MAVVGAPFDFQHFVSAQNPVYEKVCAELRAGQKRGHWMWFIFPQLRGLGHSATAAAFFTKLHPFLTRFRIASLRSQ